MQDFQLLALTLDNHFRVSAQSRGVGYNTLLPVADNVYREEIDHTKSTDNCARHLL